MQTKEKLSSFQGNFMIKINNRRYIGSKTKLLDEIYDSINEKIDVKGTVFADLFAGTGVVSYYFAQKGCKIIANDILYSNYISYKTWLNDEKCDVFKIESYINQFNNLKVEEIESNYFSDIYGDKYFSINDAKKIGYIRDEIEKEKEKLNEREYCALLTSLMYATDKIANTVGHFESYIKKKPVDHGVKMEMPDLSLNVKAELYHEDANKLAKKIKADIVYIDPPYNARQYVNFYHVLENLARWNKPTEFEGDSMKFKRNELKSGYSRPQAPELFADLVSSLNCKLIVVSYSNSYEAKSLSTINKIQEEDIISILSKRGKVTKKEISYNAFNAGKTDLKGHKEYVFVCEVGVY